MPQAEEIHKKSEFLAEAHIAALADDVQTNILVFQPRSSKNELGSKLQVLLYAPGYVPACVALRPAVKKMLKDGTAVPIYLNKKNTHFQAMVPDDGARRWCHQCG